MRSTKADRNDFNANRYTLDDAIRFLQSNDIGAGTEFNLSKLLCNEQQDDFCSISHIDDTALFALAETFQRNTTITSFNTGFLSNSDLELEFTLKGVHAIADALKNHPSLQILNFNFESYHPVILATYHGFLTMLSGTAKIKSFSYKSYSGDQGDTLALLGQYLMQQTDIENLSITEFVTKDVKPYFSHYYQMFCTSLRHLPLKKFYIHTQKSTDDFVATLAENLSHITTLTTFKLEQGNFLSDNSVLSISSILKNNSNLTELSYNGNLMTPDGVEILCSALPSLHKLKRLSLCNAGLTGKSLQHIAACFASHRLPIKQLYLAINKIDDLFIDSVCQIIQSSRELRRVSIASEEVNDDHIITLTNTLANPRLCQLSFFSCGMNQEFNDKSKSLILQAAGSNPNLCYHLDHGGTPELLNIQIQLNNKICYASQKAFINAVIELCQGYFSLERTSVIQVLPKDLFRFILYKTGDQVLGMSPSDVKYCVDRIYNNIHLRRQSIAANLYPPHASFFKRDKPTSKPEQSGMCFYL